MPTKRKDSEGTHVMYCSSKEGLTPEKEGKPILYYGRVMRVPSGTDVVETVKAVDLAEMLDGIEGGEYVPGGTMEHYEVIDRDTGDLLIMWRVPFREKKLAKKTLSA